MAITAANPNQTASSIKTHQTDKSQQSPGARALL